MTDATHIALDNYFSEAPQRRLYRIIAKPQFSPLDINLKFLQASGWSVNTDRLRFHTEHAIDVPEDHPLAQVLSSLSPHLLLRKIDKEEDYFVSLQIGVDGTILVLSNDKNRAFEYLTHVFLGIPPSFHSIDEIEIEDAWVDDESVFAMFCGMLHGACGWDPMHDMPPFLDESVKEAQKSLDIGNYKSCVVMCRRALEALLKFGYKRLLGKDPVTKKGRGLMLSALIEGLKGKGKIPDHLLYVADAVRLLGNVPGAHAADIENYQFTRYDAEFALASGIYFVEQYFTKIDTDVTTYYSVTIDLNEEPS